MAMDKLEEALQAALSQADSGEEGQQAQEPEVEEQAQPEGEQAQEPREQETPEGERAETQTAEEGADAGKAKPSPVPTARATAPKGAPAAQAAPAEGQAPRTWSPVTRQEWEKLPRPVRDQILKREGEISRALQESAQARQGFERVQKVLQPFLPHLQASGVEPVAAIENLFRAEYTLRSGTPAQKAQMIAQMMGSYGVDVETLAATLEGSPPPQNAQQAQPFRDTRLDALLGQVQQTQHRRSATVRAKAAEELQAFQANAPYLDDVRDEMADLMTAARQRGKPLTLQQAYDKACLLNDDVRTVLEQRKAEETKRKQIQKAQQARHAAGSVQSEPSPPGGSRKPSMDDALWAALSGR